MKKGRVIIDFESDFEGKCDYNISQDSTFQLDNDNLISLLEHVLGDLMVNQFN
jgi:hypothetical protein